MVDAFLKIFSKGGISKKGRINLETTKTRALFLAAITSIRISFVALERSNPNTNSN